MDLQKGVLEEVLGEGLIAGEAGQEPEQIGVVSLDEGFEGPVVAAHEVGDELLVGSIGVVGVLIGHVSFGV